MNNQIELQNYFSTSDLSLSAAISLFYPLETIDKSNLAKAQFLFRKNKKLERFVNLFWQQKIKVEPQAYFNQLKMIKTRLYGNQ